MVAALNLFSGLAALTAAGLWFWSARVKVAYDPTPDENGWSEAVVLDEHGADILKSLKQANYWSMWAAVAAGVAASCQSIAIILG